MYVAWYREIMSVLLAIWYRLLFRRAILGPWILGY